MSTQTAFPETTATVYRGRYPFTGELVRIEGDLGLYYFAGDFIAGDGFEAWLPAYAAHDSDAVAEATDTRTRR